MPNFARKPNAAPSVLSNVERIRIARALIGATPAQLAAHIGPSRQEATTFARGGVPARPGDVAGLLPPDVAGGATPSDRSSPKHLESGPPPTTAAKASSDGSGAAGGAHAPTQSLEDLARAFRAIIGWHNEKRAAELETAAVESHAAGGAPVGAPAGLAGLVREYLALRTDWERRGAVDMVMRLHGSASATAEPPRRRALLIDDSSDVLVTVGAFLDAFGFEVVSASNADAALGLLAGGTAIDLLVTDHAMPGMTGKDLAVEACRQYPSLRVLIITGYPDLDALSELPAGVVLLAKPFRRAELAARIEALFAAVVQAADSEPGGELLRAGEK